MESIISALRKGETVLVPGRRLARAIRSELARVYADEGRQVWQTPRVWSLDDWVENLLTDLVYLGRVVLDGQPVRVLHSLEVRALWQRILSTSSDQRGTPRLLPLVLEAWDLLQYHGLWPLAPNTRATAEVDTFLQWARTFEDRCLQLGVRDAASLWSLILDAIRERHVVLPSSITLYAFLPASEARLSSLMAALEVGGVIVRRHSPSAALTGEFHCSASPDDEVRQAAEQASAWVRTHEQGIVGIAIPDLNADPDRALRLVLEAAYPDLLRDPQVSAEGWVDLSVSHPFSEEPVIAAALDLLSLTDASIEFATLSGLLRSPWVLGRRAHLFARARLDAELRQQAPARWTRALLWEWLSRKGLASWPTEHRQRIHASCEALLASSRTRLPSEWISALRDYLEAWGWPGSAELTSGNWQYVQKFWDNLALLSRTDAVLGPVEWNECRAVLSLALDEPFHPKSTDARIQVLSPEALPGLRFDALWVTGLTDEAYPPPLRRNPFLPFEYRALEGAPFATSMACWSYGTALFGSLPLVAPELHFSYAVHSPRSDQRLRPSPVLELPIRENTHSSPSWTERVGRNARIALEYLSDPAHLPLASTTAVKGGASLLAAQSACPFRAFVEHRLGAKALPTPTEGLSASELGRLAHGALAAFWTAVQSQSELRAMSSEDRIARRHSSTMKALDDFRRAYPHRGGEDVLAVEEQRLERMLAEWVENVEMRREDFSVAAIEKETEMDIGPLHLSLRIDRIDRVGEGDEVLLDYKTGPVTLQSLKGERPDAPQLPLYALGSPRCIGVAFAAVMPTTSQPEPALIGLAARSIEGTKIQSIDDPTEASEHQGDSWECLLREWNRILVALAEDFTHGISRIDPKDPVQTCRLCPYPMVCRRWERLLPSEKEDRSHV